MATRIGALSTEFSYNSAGTTSAVGGISSTIVIVGNSSSSTRFFGGQTFPPKSVTTSTYITLGTDYLLLCNRAGSIGVSLTIGINQVLIFKDISGAAATNNITLTPASGTIDGAGSYVINSNYASVNVFCDGTNFWVI